jgi:hypothetical protein
MGPYEIRQATEILDSVIKDLAALPDDAELTYGLPQTEGLRTQLANLRIHAGLLCTGFTEEHFPVANRAIREYTADVDVLITLFPEDKKGLWTTSIRLKNAWHLKVLPSIYALELALAISPGVYLPEDPALFSGKDRYLRDITFEINLCYRNGAYNACSVLIRRLLETLIIGAHTKNGTQAVAQNGAYEFHHLTKLIEDVVAGHYFNLSRNAYEAMPDMKRVGDWGAHNPNVLVRRTDLDALRASARLCFEELLNRL